MAGLAAVFALAALLDASPAPGAQVTDLAAFHRDGQTFLTWKCPPIEPHGTYRIYESGVPIASAADLTGAALVAVIGDSSWYDRRLSVIQGQVFGYCIEPGGVPLTASQGLCVVTPAVDRTAFYAVTAQLAAEPEDLSLGFGINSLAAPVEERVGLPSPVFQRQLIVGTLAVDVYTLWTTHQSTPAFPAMANRPGMAWDHAVVRGGGPPGNVLRLGLHHHSGSFLTAVYSQSYPGDWVLALDDDVYGECTWWYGHHESYEGGEDPPPVTGTVHDYTYQRVLHTLLWARRTLPVDTTRVYITGGSLGAIGAAMLVLRRPDLLAAVLGVVGKVDFSYLDDPNPNANFNSEGALRRMTDRMWGTVATDLPSGDGAGTVYRSVNGTWRVRQWEREGLPPILWFSGRNDITLGWGEYAGFYDSMRVCRQGGYFFWDGRSHGYGLAAWGPMQSAAYLYRFRTNQSFPALSNCTADGDPGDGSLTSGDSIGCINAFVEWDTALVDQPDAWQVRLVLRDLQTLLGTLPAPDSAAVDVTPRRLQRFVVTPGATYRYVVTRVADFRTLAAGTVEADALGLVTIPQVPVPRTGSWLRITSGSGDTARTAVGDLVPSALSFALAGPQPSVGGARFRFGLPVRGRVEIAVYDVSGRRVARIDAGPREPGWHTAAWDSDRGTPAGVYFARLVAGARSLTLRVVVLGR